ncbi:hypothetical protein Bca4012_087121 [Brassica carinata]
MYLNHGFLAEKLEMFETFFRLIQCEVLLHFLSKVCLSIIDCWSSRFLFREDSMATFVNSPMALVNWNSHGYDVLHLLSSLPPPRMKRRRLVSDDPDLESDLDHEH